MKINFISASKLALIALIPALSACAQTGEHRMHHQHQQATSSDEIAANQNGTPTVISQGQTIVIRLSSNPSTGYGWNVTEPKDGGLQETAHNFTSSSSVPMPGAGGTEEWKYKAVKAGEYTLHFAYARSWEKNTPPVQQADIKVIVK